MGVNGLLRGPSFLPGNVMKVAVRELVPGLGGELLGNWGEH